MTDARPRKAAARKATTGKAAPRKAAPRKAATRKAAPRGGGGVKATAIDETPRKTPHRPSRRQLIIDAAITVFARKGFSDASIQDIATEAQMVPTAVYYHFSGKEELFESALRRAMDESDAVVSTARPDDADADADAFREVMLASWAWIEANPDKARLLFLHMPGGATGGAKLLRTEYEDRHVRRAYDYLPATDIPTSRGAAAAQHAARTLAVRTIISLSMGIHPLRMEGGPLASLPQKQVQKAFAEVTKRIITGA